MKTTIGGMWHVLVEGQFNAAIKELQANNVQFEVVLEPVYSENKMMGYKCIVEPEGLASRVLVTTKGYKIRVYKNLDLALIRLSKVCPSLNKFHVLSQPRERNGEERNL